MPTDPKWKTIARVSGRPISEVIALYCFLLVDASRNVTRGHVTIVTEDLSSALDVTEQHIDSILNAMQGRVLEGKELSGWGDRQPIKEDSGNPETGAKSAKQRKQEQRERERLAIIEKDGHDESRNVTTDKDKDKDKEVNQKPFAPSANALDARFEKFWGIYPKRKSKGAAEKVFLKLRPSEQLLQQMIDAIERAMTSVEWQKSGGEFIPYPATWLNSRGWEDEIRTAEEVQSEIKPWWESASGIESQGQKLGIAKDAGELFPSYKIRVFRSAGNGPWNTGRP